MKKYNTNSGFTLIELSIVIVIIGLIVGGILFGRDLIKAAEIRSTMGQVEQFKSAINTFRLKYNCLAGDCAEATTLFGAGTSNGNGNGIVGDTALATYQSIEFNLFWEHLALAQLIAGSYTTVASGTTYKPDINFPSSKLGGGFGVMDLQRYSSGGHFGSFGELFPAQRYGNVFLLGNSWSDLSSRVPLRPILSGIDALLIDSKFDDGLPAYGRIMGWRNSSGYGNLISVTAACASSDDETVATYTLTDVRQCGLLFLNIF